MKSGTYMFPPPPPPENELQVLCVPKDILGLRRGGSSIFPSAPQWDHELRYLLCAPGLDSLLPLLNLCFVSRIL
jgi:hypothetical protein